jgi:hypothetical protein
MRHIVAGIAKVFEKTKEKAAQRDGFKKTIESRRFTVSPVL